MEHYVLLAVEIQLQHSMKGQKTTKNKRTRRQKEKRNQIEISFHQYTIHKGKKPILKYKEKLKGTEG